MAKYQMFQLSDSYFAQLRAYADDFRIDSEIVRWAIDRTVMGYAMATLGFAQKRSRGFLDPQAKNPAMAWKIPVRQISGAYLAGWKMRAVSLGIWEVYNDSREAYYIEFGINHTGTGLTGSNGQLVRIRRPILKLSVLDTLAFAQATDYSWTGGFLKSFSLSSAGSPLSEMSAGAVNQSLKAGEGLVYGAVATSL